MIIEAGDWNNHLSGLTTFLRSHGDMLCHKLTTLDPHITFSSARFLHNTLFGPLQDEMSRVKSVLSDSEWKNNIYFAGIWNEFKILIHFDNMSSFIFFLL